MIVALILNLLVHQVPSDMSVQDHMLAARICTTAVYSHRPMRESSDNGVQFPSDKIVQ